MVQCKMGRNLKTNRAGSGSPARNCLKTALAGIKNRVELSGYGRCAASPAGTSEGAGQAGCRRLLQPGDGVPGPQLLAVHQ